MRNRKEEILTVALHLFARDGYEAVSVSQIAGELDKHGHHRKPERGDDDIQNALGLLTQSRHVILQLLFLHSGRSVPMASALKVRLYYTTTAPFVESRR